MRIFKLTVFVILLMFVSIFQDGCNNDNSKAESNLPNSDLSKKVSSTNENLVTFIDLGSKKCIACKMMEPVIEKLKENYKGRLNVIFYDVWTDLGKPFAIKYKIKIIPTQIIIDKNGNEVFRHQGYIPFEEVVAKLTSLGVK